MKQVIRIEHSSGKGVFSGSVTYNYSKKNSIYERHADRTKFPCYSMDFELRDQIDYVTLQNYLFAFNSLETFNNAFTAEEVKEFINKLDCKVYMITCKDYFSSPFQTVFLPETIKSKEDISFMFL